MVGGFARPLTSRSFGLRMSQERPARAMQPSAMHPMILTRIECDV